METFTRMTEIETERFWSRVMTSKNGCWIFDGKKTKRSPQGSYMLSGHIFSAKTAAWLLSGRPYERKYILLNNCDNLECVNPEHMTMYSPEIYQSMNMENYWKNKPRVSPEERKSKDKITCKKWKEKNKESYRKYQREYHRLWWKKNKARINSQF